VKYEWSFQDKQRAMTDTNWIHKLDHKICFGVGDLIHELLIYSMKKNIGKKYIKDNGQQHEI
jgi:hypothetical protein